MYIVIDKRGKVKKTPTITVAQMTASYEGYILVIRGFDAAVLFGEEFLAPEKYNEIVKRGEAAFYTD